MTAVEKCPACLSRASVAFAGDQGNGAADTAVETDPNHRYLRYPVLLGRGACKRVYKAFDQIEGIEVAWNQVELAGSDMDEEARERLFSEIRVLKTLKHRNIMSFHDWWYDAVSQTINFITEYFTSGNLRQYRKKHKHISEQAIKRWAFQILEGLLYLHAHDPPIVHRDLKCDNILVNGTSGQVKIADLGLASCQRGLSVVGTPEFMAPEIYDEVYDEKVDIYSFGMCMLELATLEYPYSECRSIPAIFRKVSQGIPPAALSKVSSQSLREFITTCINPCPEKRPQALQLLKHEFFDSLKPESSNTSPTHNSMKGGCFSPPFGSCGNLQALGSSGSHGSHGRSLRAAAAAVSSSGRSGGSSAACGTAEAAAAAVAGSLCASAAGVSAGFGGHTAVANAVLTASNSSGADAAGTRKSSHAACSGQLASLEKDSSNSSSNNNSSEPKQSSSSSISAFQQQQVAAAAASSSVDRAGGIVQPCTVCGVAPEPKVVRKPGGVAWQLAEQSQKGGGFTRGTTVCLAALNRPTEATEHDDEDSDDEVLVSLEDVLAPHPEDLLDPETYHLTSQLTHAGSGAAILSGPACSLTGRSGLSASLEARLGLSGLMLEGAVAQDDGGDAPNVLLSRYSPNAVFQHAAAGTAAAAAAGLTSSPLGGGPASVAAAGAAAGSASQRLGQDAAAQQVTGQGQMTAAAAGAAAAGGIDGASIQDVARLALGSSIDWGSASAPLLSIRSDVSAAVAALDNSSSLMSTLSNTTGSSEASSPAHQLMRTISNAGSNQKLNTGALAAAGLLQMSPGLFVPTPPLLEKLLSRNGRRAGLGGAHHSRANNSDSLSSWEACQVILSPGLSPVLSPAEQQQQQHVQISGEQEGTVAAAEGVGCQVPREGALKGGMRTLSLMPGGLAATMAGCAASSCSSTGTAATGSPASGAAAAAGVYGKILVRRRFARNLQPVLVTVKRSNTM